MASGTISISVRGKNGSVKRYKHEKEKQKIIENWKKIYGPGFLKAELKDEIDEETPSRKRYKTKNIKDSGITVYKIKKASIKVYDE